MFTMQFQCGQIGHKLMNICIGCFFTISAAASDKKDCIAPAPVKGSDECIQLWEKIGLPMADKTLDPEKFIEVCHLGYVTLYNSETKNPEWVIEKLSKKEVDGTNSRPKVKFKADPCVNQDKTAKDSDYTHSDFARGHQAASADFKFDTDWMKDTFYFSNSVPQVGAGFNSGVWSSLEGKVRNLVLKRDEIYVITGPVYAKTGTEMIIPKEQNACGIEITLPAQKRREICGGKKDNPTLSCENGVRIPIALYKIIYDPDSGRTNAYIIPNISHTDKRNRNQSVTDYLKFWRVSIDNIEERVEYNFFPGLKSRNERIREKSCPANMLR